jgi:integrase
MRPTTGRAYRSIVHRHLIPHLGTVRLADLDGRTIQRVLDQICAHRVSRRGFHDLRHGAASLAGAANVPLKVIQHDLGHSSAVTYWTVLQELARAGVAATAQLLLSHAKICIRLEAASQA